MEVWVIIIIVIGAVSGSTVLYIFCTKKSKSKTKKETNQEHLIDEKGELGQMNSNDKKTYYINNQNQNKNYIDTYSYDVKQDTQTNQKNKENYGRDQAKQQNIYQNNKSSNTVAIDIKPNNSQHNMQQNILQQTDEQKPQQIYQKIDKGQTNLGKNDLHTYDQSQNDAIIKIDSPVLEKIDSQLPISQNNQDNQKYNYQQKELQYNYDNQQQNNQNSYLQNIKNDEEQNIDIVQQQNYDNQQHNNKNASLQNTKDVQEQDIDIAQQQNYDNQQQSNKNAYLQNIKDVQEYNIESEQLQQNWNNQQQNKQNDYEQNFENVNYENDSMDKGNQQQKSPDNQKLVDNAVQPDIPKPEVIPKPVIKIKPLESLQQIINETSKKRELAEEYKYYIRRYQGKSELKKNYGLTLKASVELYKYCNAFREVRGDGNCFYTAFGFQFLSILLFDYSLDQFNEFFNRIKQIELPMKIFVAGTDLKIDDKELEKYLLDEFQRRMIKLKSIEDINQREEQFHTEFAAYEKQSDEIDGCLYGLSTLFFRNYSNYVIDFSDAKDAVYDREKLLYWEEECNSNEVVIAELAKQLNILVQLIFIENKENIVVREYGNNKEHKIILLIKPGHYNIGYFKQDDNKNQEISDPQPAITINQLESLQQIINETSKKRELAEEYKYYIRRYQGKSELKKNYGLTLKASVELYKNCNAFREVRGDGNCFYTAFGFQFLSILLFDYSLDQFNEFFNRIKQIELPMKLFVPGTDLKIDDKELEKQLLDEFQRRMLKLKSLEDRNEREEQFHTEFAAYEKQSDEIDGCLYGLSTLFFRNYSNYVIDFSDAKDAVYDREKLLYWEEECNSNEVVIAELAKQLNILVQLIFIENKENIVVREYGNNKEHKIILLIQPGHYNIGYFDEPQQLEENQEQQQKEEKQL
ncbi:unnamed protein product [Paramecium octaurelia]|uniref:OTU domain-containing protein n=1 Tax=Paramecium octaurelia TaxID=43137 RepID=A0A8S1YCY9_PAROT|nr:unnamed protein product [Paramecium octaurelia]